MQGLNSADDGKDDDNDASNRNKACMEYKNRSDNTNNRGNLNSLEIIQEILAPHTRKDQGLATANNSHIGHCGYVLFYYCESTKHSAWEVTLHVP